MEIFVYRKGSEKVDEGFSLAELPKLLADETNVVWVDLLGENEQQMEEAKDLLLNVFNFHHLTVEDCIETRNQPKAEEFANYFYFIVHGIKHGETTPVNFVTNELDGYLGSNYVVTFHVQRFRSIELVKQQIRENPFFCQRGAAFLLHHVLDEIVDMYMPIVDDFDVAINDLEDRVFDMKRNSHEILGEIMDLRRSVARLRRISNRQLEVLLQLSQGAFVQIPEHMLPFYRDVHDHLLRVSDLAVSYRDLVSGLFDIHFSVAASRANDVMKTLAVVSGIILPLSLITGIYGMNFEHMPELKSPIGYFAVLGFMVLLTVVLLIYFWRRGWIFQGGSENLAPLREPDDDFES